MPFNDPTFDLTAYRRLLLRTYGFFATWENAASHVEDPAIKSLLQDRSRLKDLQYDLQWLEEPLPGEVLPMDRLPDFSSPANLLGSMYVTEGSTLGGQVIARMLERKLELAHGNGNSFFVGHGPATGNRWKAFCRFLVDWSSAHPGAEDAMVRAACKTFEAYKSWVGSTVKQGAAPL